MSKKFLDIRDQHSKIFGHRILNSQLSLYLGILQLIVCLWSLTQHLFSMLVLNTILHCDFSSNSTLPALFTSVDAIIFDFGLFHSLWGIDGCVAQHLDGGYGRFGWCVTHSMALLFCLPFAFANRPKPYYLWPLLIQQSAYGIGLLILSLAALPRVLPTFMGDLSNAPLHAIFLYTTGTLMNFFLLYIYWHWYWFVEAQWDSARKIRNSQLQSSHNSRTGSFYGNYSCIRKPINTRHLISEFTLHSQPTKELTNGVCLGNGHAFNVPANPVVCLGQEKEITKLSPVTQGAPEPSLSKKYSPSLKTSSCCSEQSMQVKVLEAISSVNGEVKGVVRQQPKKFLDLASPASSQTSGLPVLPKVSKLRKEGRVTSALSSNMSSGSRRNSSTSKSSKESSVGSGVCETKRQDRVIKQGDKKRKAVRGGLNAVRSTKMLVKQPQSTSTVGSTNMGNLDVQRQRQQPSVHRILPNHIPISPVHPTVWCKKQPLYGQYGIQEYRFTDRQYSQPLINCSSNVPSNAFRPSQTTSSYGFYSNGYTPLRHTPALSLPERRFLIRRSAESYSFDQFPVLMHRPIVMEGKGRSSGFDSSTVISNSFGWTMSPVLNYTGL